jgi:hypothetical protein
LDSDEQQCKAIAWERRLGGNRLQYDLYQMGFLFCLAAFVARFTNPLYSNPKDVPTNATLVAET